VISAETSLSEVVPGIRVLPLRTPTLPPATHTNCVFLGLGRPGAADVVVVDPATPWDDERQRLAAMLDSLQSAGAALRAIWLTHHHQDHVGAAAWLAERHGVPIVAHEQTAHWLAGKMRVQARAGDGDTLSVGGLVLRVLHTPGHASGHLCLLHEASATLIAGDMLAGVGTIIVDPPDGDMRLYLASLRRLAAYQPEVAVPAHGPAIRPAVAKIEAYVAHRLWREARVFAALEETPAALADLLPRAYGDVAAPLLPLAERSLLAHLRKLVDDGRARADSDQRFARAHTDSNGRR